MSAWQILCTKGKTHLVQNTPSCISQKEWCIYEKYDLGPIATSLSMEVTHSTDLGFYAFHTIVLLTKKLEYTFPSKNKYDFKYYTQRIIISKVFKNNLFYLKITVYIKNYLNSTHPSINISRNSFYLNPYPPSLK